MNEHRLPDYMINNVLEVHALAETQPEFLTRRGDYQKLKQITGNGKGIKVGIADTGIDDDHLNGDLLNVKARRDFTNSRSGPSDRNGHGSHVTCHIGAKRDDQGIEGIASDVELYHAKVLGDSGSGSTAGIARGINWLVDQKCKIINLSLGGGFSREIEDACRNAKEQGVLVFAALGNSGNQGDGHPGNSEHTFGIAAVDYSKQLANFSSRSDLAIYAGYGVNVMSCWLNGRYASISGTSMATPDQVGIAALICSYMESIGKPVVNMKNYFDLVQISVEDLGPIGWDRGYGYGFIDIWKVIQANAPIDNPEPVEPEPEDECRKLLKAVVDTRNKHTDAMDAAESYLERN